MSALQQQIDHLETAIQREVSVEKLHTHLARLGGCLAQKAFDAGETPAALIVKTTAALAVEPDPNQRRVREATLAAATAVAATAPASAAPAPTRATPPSKAPLVPKPSPQPDAETVSGEWICSCGRANDPDDEKCARCGEARPDPDDDDDTKEAMLAEGRRRMGLASSRSQETPRLHMAEAVAAREPMRFVAEEHADASAPPHPESRLGRLHREGASIPALEALHAAAPRVVRR